MDKDNTKDTLILIKSVEKGFPVLGTDSSTIPPMGTMNRDGEPTYEQGDANGVAIACESDPTFVKSKPWRPMFEILFGHTALGFKQEPDKIDSQDTSRPKDYIRGHDVYTGNMSFDKPTGENRLEGATDGQWDPVKLCLEPYKHYRWFEIWVLRNPRDANGNILMNVNAVKCDMLIKHYFCLFDSLEESDDSAIRLTVPITRRYFQRFKNFKFPTSQAVIHTETLHDAGSIVPTSQPREHTRLNLKITAKTGTGTITVRGLNVCRQPISQTFAASVASLLGDEYFYSVSEIIISPGLSDVSFTLYDYDYTIKMPALA
jgi:hypothetical protein